MNNLDRTVKKLRAKTHQIKIATLDMCVKAGTGHVTSSFSCAELLVALYHGGVLKYKRSNPKWDGRDRFILSKGQASPILYATLADAGFFPKSWLNKFCQADGKFGVHLQGDVPGVEITTGSLGHGLGVAAGMALAAKKDKKGHYVFAMVGDGECYEGSIWETAIFASHNKLNNLIAITDRNGLCVTDFTEKLAKLGPLDAKWRSFGWEVKVIDGHSIEQILEVFDGIRSDSRSRPLMIIANTIKGKGVKFMENVPLWHGVAPVGAEGAKAKKELANENNARISRAQSRRTQ